MKVLEDQDGYDGFGFGLRRQRRSRMTWATMPDEDMSDAGEGQHRECHPKAKPTGPGIEFAMRSTTDRIGVEPFERAVFEYSSPRRRSSKMTPSSANVGTSASLESYGQAALTEEKSGEQVERNCRDLQRRASRR